MKTTIKLKLKQLRALCYTNAYLAVAFLIPVGLMLGAYITLEVWPFGERSVLCLDLNAQYVYYFDYIHDVLGSGESLMYSWSRNLSGEFAGIIGYYLASPFNIIVWLFPREMITEGLLCMLLAKFGACGAGFAFCIHRCKGVSKKTAMIFSPMYAMCAYMVVQTLNPMWLDGVIILPFVCYGIESLIRFGRFKMLVLSLVYAFVSNFYIGLMIAIFTVLYYICGYFTVKKYTCMREFVPDFLKRGAFTGLCGITAALISSFLLLPVYNSLNNGKFTFTEPDYSAVPNFELMDIAQKLFGNTYDTVRNDGLPFLFCGSLTLVLAAGFFCSGRFRFGARIGSGVLLGLLLASMYIKPVDMIWHGGQVPNWIPYRYSFMVSFVLVMLAAQAFDSIKHLKTKTIGFITISYILLIIYIETRDTFNAGLGDEGRELFDGISVALPAIAFMAIAGIIAYAVHKKKAHAMSWAMCIIVIGGVSGELCFNAANTFAKMHVDVVYSTRESYTSVILPLREKVEEIRAQDDGFYRIEKNFFRTVNDPIAANMYGLSHSSSTLNQRTIDMLGYFGFTSNGHYTRFSGNTPLTCDIFGVKYILNTDENSTASIKSKDDITAETNENALPLLYLTDMAIAKADFEPDNVFDNQNKLLGAMTGDPSAEYFTVFSPLAHPVYDNCTKDYFAGGHIGFVDAKDDASVTYKVTAPDDGVVYMYIPTDYEREVYVYANEEYIGVCFESDNHNIKKLGTFAKGEEISVKLVLKRSDLYIKEPQFAMLDTQKEEAAIEQLLQKGSGTSVEKLSSTNLKVTASVKEDSMLFTTIPYEKGWTVYVDGKPVQPEALVEDALMGIPLTAGEHTVELVFFSAGLGMGIVCTVCGILIFAALIYISRKLKAPVKLAESGNEEAQVRASIKRSILAARQLEADPTVFPDDLAQDD